MILNLANATSDHNQIITYVSYTPVGDYHNLIDQRSLTTLTPPGVSTNIQNAQWKLTAIRPISSSEEWIKWNSQEMYSRYTPYIPLKDGVAASGTRTYSVYWNADENTQILNLKCESNIVIHKMMVKYFQCLDSAQAYYNTIDNLNTKKTPKALIDNSSTTKVIITQKHGYYMNTAGMSPVFTKNVDDSVTTNNNYGKWVIGDKETISTNCPTS